jgi:ABC-2 type transport system permease protein
MTTQTADLELRDVRGPSALSGGWRRFWELTRLLAVTDFKRTYFGTALGYLWSVARPLLLFAVLVEVFTHVFRLGATVPHYPAFLLFNFVFFGFFSEATTSAVPSIVSQEGIVRKTQFPRLAIPTAVVLSALFNLLLNMIVVFVFIIVLGVSPAWTWLLFPVLVAMMCTITLPVAMILSSLYPRFRDLSLIWTVFATALFYATPVLYPYERVVRTSHHLAQLIALNPITPILELSRRWIIDPHAPYPGTAATGGFGYLVVGLCVTVVICILAVWVFTREAPRIAEEL